MSDALDPRELGRLKWRCRRGLLENDLLIERFFAAHGDTLTRSQARGLQMLMALADNDLLDLLLRRREPSGRLDTPDVHGVLALMRPHRAQGFPDTHASSTSTQADSGSEEPR